jgi:hypothetical protein
LHLACAAAVAVAVADVILAGHKKVLDVYLRFFPCTILISFFHKPLVEHDAVIVRPVMKAKMLEGKKLNFFFVFN